MRQLQTQARFGLLMSALALISAPSAVLAQEAACESDTDCDHGYTCEAVGGGCPAIDCAEGSDCQIPECETVLGCVPARDCEADSDCADGWKCATEQYSDCATNAADPACAPGEECGDRVPDPVNPPDCETKEVSYCAPPWALPCESAADCGASFECVELIAMSCSGSSGGGSAGDPQPVPDPGFAPPAEGDPLPPEEATPGECTSEPTGELACKLIETTCSTHADCPAGLTCQESYGNGVSCGGATPEPDLPDNGSGSAGSGGGADPDADARPADCAPPEPTFACAPPSYFDGYGYGYDLDGRGEGTAGTDSSDDESSDGDADPNGDTGGAPTAAPVDDERELSSGDNDAADMTSESSGCSATGGSPASGSMLLTALAVLGLAVRRRVLGA